MISGKVVLKSNLIELEFQQLMQQSIIVVSAILLKQLEIKLLAEEVKKFYKNILYQKT
jgi:hypothetical protein